MKNVTLSADENLIEQARLVARSRRSTLNAAILEWRVSNTLMPAGTSHGMRQIGSWVENLYTEALGRGRGRIYPRAVQISRPGP